MKSLHDREVEVLNDTIRKLRFDLGRANKTMGKQGTTIHGLRAELCLAREESSKIERGELRRYERLLPERNATIKELREENHDLAVKFAEQRQENKELRHQLENHELYQAQTAEKGPVVAQESSRA